MQMHFLLHGFIVYIQCVSYYKLRNSKFTQIEHKHAPIGGRGTDFITPRVPTHLENATRSLVAVHELPGLCGPYMHTLVKTAAGQELSVGTECHRVYGFGVLCECVNTGATFHIPESYGRVETRRGEYQVHVGVLGARSRGGPFDGVYFLVVGLQVVDAGVLLHRPYF